MGRAVHQLSEQSTGRPTPVGQPVGRVLPRRPRRPPSVGSPKCLRRARPDEVELSSGPVQ